MRIRYEVSTQGSAWGGGTHRTERVVEAPDINIGFVKAAIETLAALDSDEEIVSVTFWQVEAQ